MIIQSDNPLRLIRELGPAAWAVFSILQLSGNRVTQKYLETWTGMTDKTVSKALAYLEEIGLVNHSRSGWMLLGETRQLPLTMQLQPEDTPAVRASTEEASNANKKCHSRRNSDSLKSLTTGVVGEEPELNSNPSPPAPNYPEEPQVGNFSAKDGILAEARQVIDAAEGLFSQRIMGEPGDYADIDRLLAWIAKAYDGHRLSDRSRILNPAGMIYWAFHQGKNIQIEKKYLDWNSFGQRADHDPDFAGFLRDCGQFEDAQPEAEPGCESPKQRNGEWSDE
jgi:hypothetical protein